MKIWQDAQKGCPARPQPMKAPEAQLLGYVEDAFKVRTPLADCFSILLLLNACLALEPPHILHDLIDISRSDGVDLRHVTKLPMVRLDAVGCRPLEGLVSVMVRLVNLVHQRRSVVGSCRLFPMTCRTVCVECGFARLELGRHSAAHGRLCRLCRL